MPTKQDKKIITDIFQYILEKQYLTAREAKKTFGYRSTSSVANLKNEKKSQTITNPHMQLLRIKHQIPTRIWKTEKNYTKASIDYMIEKYRLRILNISNRKESTSNPFQQNKKFLPLLEGIWYIYSFAVDPEEFHDGVILRVTTIHNNYTVEDSDGNSGYLNIRSKESYIEKATKDIENVVLIRFFNEHITHDILVCSISSTIRQKTNEPLLNYAFMSRKKYSSPEAKRILNNKSELQLKIDLNFFDRIDQEVKSRY